MANQPLSIEIIDSIATRYLVANEVRAWRYDFSYLPIRISSLMARDIAEEFGLEYNSSLCYIDAGDIIIVQHK